MDGIGNFPRPPSQEDLRRLVSPQAPTAGPSGAEIDNLTNDHTLCPNRWAQWRMMFREPAAEFLGTMILVLFGNGVLCQVVLGSDSDVSSSPKGDYLSVSLGWAVGIALGVWVCGGISGGHINPAVTLSLAVFRGFPWKKVPVYMFAQLMGALCGAACVYATYFHAIDIFEGGQGIRTVPGTASLFATYASGYMTSVSCFFNEFLSTAVLLMVIFAATDKGNLSPPHGLLPIVLFVTVLGIAACFGMQTGFAINPARDLGPRLLTAMVGYGGSVFSFRSQYWLWCATLGPFAGALAGALVYDAFIYVGPDSILNRPSATALAHQKRTRNPAV
ncbi:aquaporin [Gautieria morchelliformis]|nr:aquaporin [Gautieria morchelliformis]